MIAAVFGSGTRASKRIMITQQHAPSATTGLIKGSIEEEAQR